MEEIKVRSVGKSYRAGREWKPAETTTESWRIAEVPERSRKRRWILRFHKAPIYRGGSAEIEETIPAKDTCWMRVTIFMAGRVAVSKRRGDVGTTLEITKMHLRAG